MERRKKIYMVSLWLIPLIFYIFFWWLDGAVWCADTNSYVDMRRSREPLYPLYLACFRMFLGREKYSVIHPEQYRYLVAAILGQSVLAAYAAYNICSYLTEKFRLGKMVTYIVLFFPMVTSLLCRFAAKRASMYSNSILTEGLAISIYVLFIRYCLSYLLDRNIKSFWICAVLATVGITIRKQMYILLILLMIAGVYMSIIVLKSAKSVLKVMAVGVLIFVAARLFDCAYNYAIHGTFAGHTEDNRFVSTMAFYVAEREDVQFIQPELQDLYLEVYDECDKNGWMMHSAPSGWYDSVAHFEDVYDFIQLDTMEVILQQKVKDNDYSWLGEGDQMDLIRDSWNKSLLVHRIPRLFKVFFNNIIAGLVITVAVKKKILCLYALLAYLLYIALLVITAKKQLWAAFGVGLTVLISIFGNVGLVAAVIFAQTRYTIYNMPLFYIAITIMLWEIAININGTKKSVKKVAEE